MEKLIKIIDDSLRNNYVSNINVDRKYVQTGLKPLIFIYDIPKFIFDELDIQNKKYIVGEVKYCIIDKQH